MAHYFAVSPHTRHNIVGHHPEVGKNKDGIRGEPSEWLGNQPTPDGFIGLGQLALRLVDYAQAVRDMNQRDVVGPTIAIATPKRNQHCRSMGELVVRSMRRSGVRVLHHELDGLDSIAAPPLTKHPLHTLTRSEGLAVKRFNEELKLWEDGALPAMPDPRLVGDTMGPSDYLERALRGQRFIAGITDADVVFQMLTTTGVYLACAALDPGIDRALATGVFPATSVKRSRAHIYEHAPMGQPVRITAEPVEFRDLVPPQVLPPLDALFNDMANVPLV